MFITVSVLFSQTPPFHFHFLFSARIILSYKVTSATTGKEISICEGALLYAIGCTNSIDSVNASSALLI